MGDDSVGRYLIFTELIWMVEKKHSKVPWFQFTMLLLKFSSPLNRYFSQITHTNRIYLYNISCLWGVFAKNTCRETNNFPSRQAREILSQDWYFSQIPVPIWYWSRTNYHHWVPIIANLHVTREHTRIFWPFFADDNNKWWQSRQQHPTFVSWLIQKK